MRKVLTLLATSGVGFLLASGIAFAEDNQSQQAMAGMRPELHVYEDSKVLIRGAKVTGISGNDINAELVWGSLVLRGTIQTDSSTEFVRRSGDDSALLEITVGDYISFRGRIVANTATPTVKAEIVKNWSLQRRNVSFEGTVKSVDTGAKTFVLGTEKNGDQKIMVVTNTEITKDGSASSTFADIMVNDTVTVKGLWNITQNTVEASKIRIRAPKLEYKVIQGTLKATSGSSTPTTLTVTVGNRDYTVKIASDTAILKRDWSRASLADLKVGDTVRAYGAVSGQSVDATVVRDTSL